MDSIFGLEVDKCKGKFLSNRIKTRIDRLFKDVADFEKQVATCAFHGTCHVFGYADGEVLDMVTLGPPCGPYCRRGHKAVKDASKHPLFKTLWEGTLEFFKSTKPKGGYMEEVSAFAHRGAKDFLCKFRLRA